MLHVLIVTDDPGAVSIPGKSPGLSIDVVADTGDSGAQAKPPKLNRYDVAILDIDRDEWQRRMIELRTHLPVIAFSRADIRRCVEAMKLGAADYADKPLSLTSLRAVLTGFGQSTNDNPTGLDEIVGMSRPMQEVFGLIRKAAMSESTVLITGESGTGKEPVAQAIHRWSPRKDRAFMTINCSAIPDTLLESELFGFEKGAFTGANYTKKGILELADGGTVLLDEIGDVSPLFQIKVLRVIQEGEIMRIGGMKPITVDVRILAATNRDLKTAKKKGTFREDLYYRLNVINIHLPPLRERMEDIPLLVDHFIVKHAAKRKDLLIRGISDDALAILMNYSYPGNVRELENIIERAISFANAPLIYPADLPSALQQSPAPRRISKLKETLEAAEKELIWSALQDSRGNISRAADSLGIHRQQLQRKIKHMK